MKNTFATLGLILSLLIFFSCSKPPAESETAGETEVATDTISLDDAVSDVVDDDSQEDLEALRGNIDYWGSVDDSVEVALASFTPLEDIFKVSRKAFSYRDSISENSSEGMSAKDSTAFGQRSKKAYAAIVAYQQAMKAGVKLNDRLPKLTDIVRTPGEKDKTSEILPAAGKSDFLSNGNFFFLGGAPYASRHEEVVQGPNGKPENRYGITGTENANYFFNSVFHQTGGSVDLTFGPPLSSYYGYPVEINGVGSLIHKFAQRAPAFFITERGLVAAQLVSVTIKLAPEPGCSTNEPYYEFACDQNIDAQDILAVFVPYFEMSSGKASANRESRALWTADMNGDGVADFAAVSSVFSGGSSDTMNQVLWFVNIDGAWRIIDSGVDPDCT
ncbi:MAG TPA: hypothetical protein VK508_21200 [Cyclobacteriaceae bacterium]|nr:hypothetical protein [Cyclobacteriaceae bacterium]